MSCGCKKPQIFDLSRSRSIPWECALRFYGEDKCGKTVVIDKPIHELTALDREKLDGLILDGNGDLFLSDDGTYKKVDVSKVENIVLEYNDDPANFVITNQSKINRLRYLLNRGMETFVRMQYQQFALPMSVSYTDHQLLLAYDAIRYPIRQRGPQELEYERLKIDIVLDTRHPVSRVLFYQLNTPADADYVIHVNGDGASALYNDGTYKTTYTQEQSDAHLASTLEDYDTTIIVDGKLSELHDTVSQELATALEDYDTTVVVDGKLSDLHDTVTRELTTALEDYDTTAVVDGKLSDLHAELRDEITEATKDAVMYESSTSVLDSPVYLRGDLILENDRNLFGTTLTGGLVNLIQCSRYTDDDNAIVDLGSRSAHLTLNSVDRPNVQYKGERGSRLHELAYLNEVEAVQTNVETVQSNVDALSQTVSDHVAEYDAFKSTVNDAFDTVNNELSEVNGRIDQNAADIATNRSDIDGIIEDLVNTHHFRGSYQTFDELAAIPNPETGDYAYVYDNLKVYIYNGSAWENSGKNVPDQSVPASDATPLVDAGLGESGSSNEYARGDHRHPTDMTRAAVTDLADYLPLAGNTQTDPMTGDLWLGTRNKLNLSDSGNSYLGFDDTSATLELKGNGAGGVDIQSELGTIKANGQQVITQGFNDTVGISTRSLHFEGTASGKSPAVFTMESGDITLHGGNLTLFGNPDVAINSQENIVLSSDAGKAYYGAETIPCIEIAKISDVEAVSDSVADELTGYLKLDMGGNITGTTQYKGTEILNQQDYVSIIDRVSENYVKKAGDTLTGDLEFSTGNVTVQPDASFRMSGNGAVRIGYSSSDDQMELIATTTTGGVDVVTNPSSATSLFKYNGKEVATVEDVNTVEGDLTGLADQLSGYITDNDGAVEALTVRVSTNETGIASTKSDIAALSTKVSDYITDNDTAVDALATRVATNESDITTNKTGIASNKSDIADLSTKVSDYITDNDAAVVALEGRVSINETGIAGNKSDITSLREALNNREHFRGYYDTAAETATIPTPKLGDYCWIGQTGTVFTYNGVAWSNTNQPIPSAILTPADTLPLMDGEADAGESLNYAAGDHRHPSDVSKQDVLVSGVNLKTVGGETLLGAGDVHVPTTKYCFGILDETGSFSIGFERRMIVAFYWKRTLLYPNEYSYEDTTGTFKIKSTDIDWAENDDVYLIYSA